MIRVTPKPEPDCFDTRVRVPGNKFLLTKSPSDNFRPYWTRCIKELYASYEGICAYLGIYIYKTGGVTVDHFIPKSAMPELAYEWDNYRLCSSIINSRKHNYQDIIDPFDIDNEWIYLNFLTGEVFPNPSLSNFVITLINQTIFRLKLNYGDTCDIRMDYWTEYCERHIDIDYLKRKAPFIYKEASRQRLL